MFSIFQKLQKAVLITAVLSLGYTTGLQAQGLSGLFNQAKDALSGQSNQNKSGSTSISDLTNTDISSGLKAALEQGAKVAADQLSQKDGFFKDAAVKILLPKEAQSVANTLRSVGMGSLVDNAILQMNRAAEDAAVKAAPIFINAIKGITIQDGVSILTGPNNAATQYLEGKTTGALTQAFAPVIEQSLGKTGATKAWKTVFDTYNKLPFKKNAVNSDLTGYVTEQALKGVFTKMAGEELKIRQDPAGQASGIISKVFGAK